MDKVLEWSQGGQNHMVFANQIIMIIENEHNVCDLHLVGFEEPIKSSLSLNQIRIQLNINTAI